MTTTKAKTTKTKAVKTYYCDRNLAFYKTSPWTEARLTNFFNWVDDGGDLKRAIDGLKTWKGSQSYRLTTSDNMAIDYVLKCYNS
jgi:hypothetical protein